jgi:hypothetical protein
MGLGFTYRRGLELATKAYVTLVPGDNEFKADSLITLSEHIGEADIILPYPANAYIRPWYRRLASWGFTCTINLITGFRLRYFNGQAIQKTEIIRSVPFHTNGFAYQAEILFDMLRKGHTYVQAPFELNYSSRRTRVFRPRNVASVIRSVFSIAWRAWFRR